MPSDPDSLLDAIAALASTIARQSPESTEPALQIVALVDAVRAHAPDHGTLQDALDAQGLDESLSDVSVRNASEAVVAALRRGD